MGFMLPFVFNSLLGLTWFPSFGTGWCTQYIIWPSALPSSSFLWGVCVFLIFQSSLTVQTVQHSIQVQFLCLGHTHNYTFSFQCQFVSRLLKCMLLPCVSTLQHILGPNYAVWFQSQFNTVSMPVWCGETEWKCSGKFVILESVFSKRNRILKNHLFCQILGKDDRKKVKHLV